jgi:hypothetical protein
MAFGVLELVKLQSLSQDITLKDTTSPQILYL